MRPRLIRPVWITRATIRAAPETLFAFGDNMHEAGYGGQAKAARGEPNAVGVPTKWTPGRFDRDYFGDHDMRNPEVVGRIDAAFRRMEAHLAAGGSVAIPAAGLGTGLAELPDRAPALAAYIEARIARLGEVARVAA